MYGPRLPASKLCKQTCQSQLYKLTLEVCKSKACEKLTPLLCILFDYTVVLTGEYPDVTTTNQSQERTSTYNTTSVLALLGGDAISVLSCQRMAKILQVLTCSSLATVLVLVSLSNPFPPTPCRATARAICRRQKSTLCLTFIQLCL